jgi:DNA polymerase III epsilon subunit-like protein
MNPFLCSRQLSKEAFPFTHLSLKHICKRLKISLQHHEPESDAKAAAKIVIEAARKMRVHDTVKLLKICDG